MLYFKCNIYCHDCIHTNKIQYSIVCKYFKNYDRSSIIHIGKNYSKCSSYTIYLKIMKIEVDIRFLNNYFEQNGQIINHCTIIAHIIRV